MWSTALLNLTQGENLNNNKSSITNENTHNGLFKHVQDNVASTPCDHILRSSYYLCL